MTTRTLAALSTLALTTFSAPASAAWGDHLDTAGTWLADIEPENNEYASPSSVEYVDGVLTVSAVCGGFVSELMKASYPALTDDVMSALVDDDPSDGQPWASPDSAHWYDAIVDERSATDEGLSFAFDHVADVDDLQEGDILASVYTSAGSTGHTMVVFELPETFALVTTTIPGYSGVQVERYRITVLDSTKSVHLNRSDSTDSRYMADTDPDDPDTAVNDAGMGTGELYLYADRDTGEIIGWTWNVIQSTAYQGTDATKASYRPIVAGRLGGTGI